jgi:NAD(P)-dependent dehydrogenase (short-subunit alcohol dehydrogenase family)
MNLRFPKITALVFILSVLLGFSYSSHALNERKAALVTGASRGIGFSLTKQLLEEGLHVIAVARNVEPLNALSEKFPDQLQIISADLSTREGQLSVAPAVNKRSIDYLVHNAAIIAPLGQNALLEAPPEEIHNIIEVNVIAPMILTNQLSRNLKAGSRVLMISSRAGEKAVQGLGLYCVSKVALDRYTESLQLDTPHGILTAAVHPGDVDTDMQGDLRQKDTTHFPKGSFFRENSSKLTPPEVSGRYLKWLLLKTTDKEFTAQKHNIYDPSHHAAWSEGTLIKDPFN